MTVKNRLGYALLAGLAIAGLSPQAMSLPLGSREPQLSGKAALATDAGTACVECASGSQRIAWLVWGRRGKSKAVAPTAFSWPAGHKWPDDALSPARWGKIALAAMPASAEAQGSEVLVAAPGELAIAADGILSHREWDLALANVQSTAAGPMLTVAQWKDNALALAIAFPAIPTLSPRTKAVLVLGPPTPDTSCLPPTARAYAIQWDARRQVSVLEIAHPDRGNWKWRPVTGSSEEGAETTFRGAIAGSGDGGLQFVSAEFLVPLVGPLAPAEGRRELAGAFFVLDLPSRAQAQDAVFWPFAHAPALPRQDVLLLEHPDGWAKLTAQKAASLKGSLLLQPIEAAPQIDGLVADAEWQGAAATRASLPHLTSLELRIGLAGAALNIGLKCDTPRQTVVEPRLELYFDPQGDGGLLPRPDDRAVFFPAGGHRGVVLSWSMPPELLNQGVITRQGDWDKREAEEGEWACSISGATVAAEAAVPLSALGLQPDNLPPAMGFLVRLVYTATFKL